MYGFGVRCDHGRFLVLSPFREEAIRKCNYRIIFLLFRIYLFMRLTRFTVEHMRLTVKHMRLPVKHMRLTVKHMRLTVKHMRLTVKHMRLTVKHIRLTVKNVVKYEEMKKWIAEFLSKFENSA